MRPTHILLTLCGILMVLAVGPVAAQPTREIVISGNDAMQFDIKELTARPGERLRVKLRHTGRMPAATMGHNWVLLQRVSASEVNAIGMESARRAPDYLPRDRSLVLVYTKVIGGGQIATVEFTAPTEPGEYPFLCTFPGHFTMMRGKLVIEASE